MGGHQVLDEVGERGGNIILDEAGERGEVDIAENQMEIGEKHDDVYEKEEMGRLQLQRAL